jgi:zinc-ribbon domain
MTCTSCGSENAPGAKFCFHCGGTLAVAESVAPGLGPVPEAVGAVSAGAPGAGQQPQPAPGGWQTNPAPHSEFNLPKAPGGLQHFTQEISASGAAFHGFTNVMRNITAPLAPMGKLIPAAVGSLLIILGTFFPQFSVFDLSFNFWTTSKATTFIVVVLAIVAVIMAVFQLYAWLWICWGLTFLLIALGFFDQILTSNGYGASWGWIFVWLGNIVLFIAAAIPESSHTWIGQRAAQ